MSTWKTSDLWGGIKHNVKNDVIFCKYSLDKPPYTILILISAILYGMNCMCVSGSTRCEISIGPWPASAEFAWKLRGTGSSLV